MICHFKILRTWLLCNISTFSKWFLHTHVRYESLSDSIAENIRVVDVITDRGTFDDHCSWTYIFGIDIKLLKIACPVISKSLAYVVNSSLDNGIVHDDWKKARVTPNYKNEGEINDENNFRPISVISHIAKMIESFVSDQIIKYLEDHAFISIDQSDYLKRHSTQTSLHRVLDDWLEQIHDNSLTGAC